MLSLLVNGWALLLWLFLILDFFFDLYFLYTLFR